MSYYVPQGEELLQSGTWFNDLMADFAPFPGRVLPLNPWPWMMALGRHRQAHRAWATVSPVTVRDFEMMSGEGRADPPADGQTPCGPTAEHGPDAEASAEPAFAGTLEERNEEGLRFHRMGRLVEAERIYKGILAESPDHAEVLHLIGVLELQRDAPEAAIRHLQRAVALSAENLNYLNNFGAALMALNRFEEAADAFERALATAPDDIDARINLANALFGQGKLDQAVPAYQAALDQDATALDGRLNLGVALSMLGRLEEARGHLQTVHAAEPDDSLATAKLAECHFKLKDFEAAEPLYQSVSDAKTAPPPVRAQALRDLGRIALIRRDFTDAETLIEQSLALNPEDADALADLGMAFTGQHRLDDAKKAFQKALALDPEQPTACDAFASDEGDTPSTIH